MITWSDTKYHCGNHPARDAGCNRRLAIEERRPVMFASVERLHRRRQPLALGLLTVKPD